MKELVDELMTWCHEHYGCSLHDRMAKLKEEVSELEEAIEAERQGRGTKEAVRDEATDVLIVLLHIICLVAVFPQRLLFAELEGRIFMTFRRIKLREKDANFEREHPHK